MILMTFKYATIFIMSLDIQRYGMNWNFAEIFLRFYDCVKRQWSFSL